jgi:hypothetical protein
MKAVGIKVEPSHGDDLPGHPAYSRIDDAADHAREAHAGHSPAGRAKVGGVPVHARDYFFVEIERTLKGKNKKTNFSKAAAPQT